MLLLVDYDFVIKTEKNLGVAKMGAARGVARG